MTFRSRTLKLVTIALAVTALGASAAPATQMTHQEQQVIASRGVGAPYPKVTAPQGVVTRHAQALGTTSPKSSGGPGWGAITAIVAGALAACAAFVAAARRHTAATPR
jgi:hypothetical protein